jgi:hypothetical protein
MYGPGPGQPMRDEIHLTTMVLIFRTMTIELPGAEIAIVFIPYKKWSVGALILCGKGLSRETDVA